MEQVFQPEKARDSLVNELRKLAETRGFSKVVVGISGGKDSTVTAAICARALGADHVYGVMMPDGEQKDIADSIRVCEALGIHRRTVNIGKMHAALKEVTDRLQELSTKREKEEREQTNQQLQMLVRLMEEQAQRDIARDEAAKEPPKRRGLFG